MTAADTPDDTPNCPSSASPVEPGQEFCNACGTALTPTRRIPPRALWAVLAALAVGAVAAFTLTRGDDGGSDGDGPVIVATPIETAEPIETVETTDPAAGAAPPTSVPPTSVAPTTSATPLPPAPVTTVAPAPTAPPASVVDVGPPGFFPTPEEAIADHLSQVSPPYAGTCESLAGREVELGGTVACSVLDQDLIPQQIHRWGVFATDDIRGWMFLDVGSAGWSVADESFEFFPPDESDSSRVIVVAVAPNVSPKLKQKLGSHVMLDVAETAGPGSVGEYGWAGAAKTYYWVDPAEELVGVFMSQYMTGVLLPERDFRSLTYQAIDD